jgi:hypothetical protein
MAEQDIEVEVMNNHFDWYHSFVEMNNLEINQLLLLLLILEIENKIKYLLDL